MKFNVQKLYLIMVEQGLNISSLSKKARVSRVTLSFILRNHRQPNLETIGKLSKALNVSPLELVVDSEN